MIFLGRPAFSGVSLSQPGPVLGRRPSLREGLRSLGIRHCFDVWLLRSQAFQAKYLRLFSSNIHSTERIPEYIAFVSFCVYSNRTQIFSFFTINLSNIRNRRAHPPPTIRTLRVGMLST